MWVDLETLNHWASERCELRLASTRCTRSSSWTLACRSGPVPRQRPPPKVIRRSAPRAGSPPSPSPPNQARTFDSEASGKERKTKRGFHSKRETRKRERETERERESCDGASLPSEQDTYTPSSEKQPSYYTRWPQLNSPHRSPETQYCSNGPKP